jgi:2-iminobutanoate/2-iminopropanoate deaminase
MERRAIRVEPFSTYPGQRGGEPAPFRAAAEIVLEQMKRCLEAAGSALERVVKCNVYCTDPSCFGKFNEIYARYFHTEPPARIFLCVACFPGPFDIEIDCIAVA